MLRLPVLLLVLGSASLWVLTEGASTIRPEDDMVTPGAEDKTATPGAEDKIVTPGVSEKPNETTDLTALVPTSTESVTHSHNEDYLSTFKSTVPRQEESQSTTTPGVATGSSTDGLETATLVGIIIGILVLIGVIGGIIFVIVRKTSGRYS
ncbi:podoplanin [Orycteropus afer afer]|uniref:Podoplanin n=1 Tax=Orycteropus afer afer TaxID=1230840 RepID=A0AC54ZCW3_ORYAF|nr:podoplanin [Orycteropus afer afer]